MENIKNTSGLELEKIKEIWAGLALTAAARAKIEEAGPIPVSYTHLTLPTIRLV